MATEYARYYSALDDYNAGDPIDDRDIDGEFDQVRDYLNRKVLAKGTAPTSPTNGDTWIDTTNKRAKFYRVSEWVDLGMVYVAANSSDTPSGLTSAQEGDLWYDTTNDILWRYDGSSWGKIGNMIFPSSTAQGDLLYLSASETLARLAKDTNESRYLSNQGTDNNPQWEKVDIATGIEIASEAQGDIIYRAASAWARLGAGTANQFLKTLGAGANPAWADIEFKKIAHQEETSTTNSTNITISEDKNYMVVYQGKAHATTDTKLYMRFNDDSSGYANTAGGTVGVDISEDALHDANQEFWGVAIFSTEETISSNAVRGVVLGTYNTTASGIALVANAFQYNDASDITSVEIAAASSAFQNIILTVYELSL